MFSGILNARSGSWLTVATGVNSFNGVGGTGGLRVNQISDDVYGEKTLTSYLNRAAFEQPAPGAFGNHELNSIRGPGLLEDRPRDLAAVCLSARRRTWRCASRRSTC